MKRSWAGVKTPRSSCRAWLRIPNPLDRIERLDKWWRLVVSEPIWSWAFRHYRHRNPEVASPHWTFKPSTMMDGCFKRSASNQDHNSIKIDQAWSQLRFPIGWRWRFWRAIYEAITRKKASKMASTTQYSWRRDHCRVMPCCNTANHDSDHDRPNGCSDSSVLHTESPDSNRAWLAISAEQPEQANRWHHPLASTPADQTKTDQTSKIITFLVDSIIYRTHVWVKHLKEHSLNTLPSHTIKAKIQCLGCNFNFRARDSSKDHVLHARETVKAKSDCILDPNTPLSRNYASTARFWRVAA